MREALRTLKSYGIVVFMFYRHYELVNETNNNVIITLSSPTEVERYANLLKEHKLAA